MTRRALTLTGMVGFLASALAHLATFSETLTGRLPDGLALALFAGAFAPLGGVLVRLRWARAVARPGRRWAVVDWRALLAPVPPGARLVVFATAAYALMNLTLSVLIGVEAGSTRALDLRVLSGHLLLLYLLPLVFFLFVDPTLDAPP